MNVVIVDEWLRRLGRPKSDRGCGGVGLITSSHSGWLVRLGSRPFGKKRFALAIIKKSI